MKLEAKEKRRVEFVRKFEAAKATTMRDNERGPVGATLNRCPLIIPQLQMAYTPSEGLIHLPPDWPAESKRSTPPFPLNTSALLPLPAEVVAELASDLSNLLDDTESLVNEEVATQAQSLSKAASTPAQATSAPVRPVQAPQQSQRKRQR